MIQVFEKLEAVPSPPPQGTYVVVDVLRFSTTACTIFDRGAQSIRPVRSEEEAFQYREDHEHTLLAGEEHAKRIPGFDAGNSPSRFCQMDLTGLKVACLTSNGTRALNELSDRDVMIGCLSNAKATASLLGDRDTVHLVACGSKGTSCQEDVAGTELIRSYLEDRVPDDAFIKQIQEQVRSASHAASLREKGHEEDVRFATQVNRHDVVPALQSDLLKPITVHDHEE